MANLAKVQSRFEVEFKVIEGGSGHLGGVISEAEQSSQPTYIFIQPRHVLRVRLPSALRTGMVLMSPAGDYYVAGENGASENYRGVLWQSYRLFEATRTVKWQRRVKSTDVVTGLERDSYLEDLGDIWAALEPTEREVVDRRAHMSLEQSRFITGANVLEDDLLDGRPVTRADTMLGVRVGMLS